MEKSKKTLVRRKRITQIDLTEKLMFLIEKKESLSKDRLELANNASCLANDKLKFNEEVTKLNQSEDELLLDKIFMLRCVMTSEYGDMKMSMGESLISKHIFNEDDMITLKGKMMELIKKL